MHNDDEIALLEDVECDGCGRLLGACASNEWEELFSKSVILCGQCDESCVGPDTYRRIGNHVLAAQIERQWTIDRSLCNHGDVFKGRGNQSDIPF